MIGEPFRFEIDGIERESGDDDGDAEGDIPCDGFFEDGGSEAHGDNRFDEEGVGSVGSAVCFDSSHEAQVSEAGDDDAGIEQDADRIGADAFDDRFVECDEDDEFEEGAE